MKRRALLTAWLLIIACMLVGLAEEPQILVCGDYEYRLPEDRTAEITGYTGTEAELLIPASLNEHAVTTIGDKAFSGCCGLTKMTLPQSLKSIGFQAFMHCCSLTEVTLPEGLVTIGGEAFVGCWKLESITIPASVTEIVSYPFAACDALSVISVKRGSYAAWWCRTAGLPHIFTDPYDWLLD